MWSWGQRMLNADLCVARPFVHGCMVFLYGVALGSSLASLWVALMFAAGPRSSTGVSVARMRTSWRAGFANQHQRRGGMTMTWQVIESGDTYRLEYDPDTRISTILCLACHLRSTHVMDIAERFCTCCARYHTHPEIRCWPRVACPHVSMQGSTGVQP